MEKKIEQAKAIRVTLIGGVINLVLGLSKMAVGSLYLSHALFVDGLHSLSDVISDIFVLIVAKFSHEEPDEDHPYGHGRFETLGTTVIGILLLVVAGIFAFDNISKFLTHEEVPTPGWPAFVVTIISIMAKEGIYQFATKVGREINSPLIMANAWHARTDAFSSIIVLLGLGVSIMGYPEVDIIVAAIISVFIAKIGWDFLWQSLKELVDTGLSAEELTEIKKEILAVDGVISFHHLRSRVVGANSIIDVNVEVANRITASEGHEISSWVAKNLIDKFEHVADVTVHTDVEDDVERAYKLLPLRDEILKIVEEQLGADLFSLILDMNIHYKGNKITLELITDTSSSKFKNDFIEKILSHELINDVKILAVL